MRNLLCMSNDDNNASGAGRTLDGRPAEPLPSSWARPSTGQRVGRIGDWAKYELFLLPFSHLTTSLSAPVAEKLEAHLDRP